MAAARAVFSEKGYTEALISDIAERAGIVEGTIYRFFANKHELLQKVAESWFEEIISNDGEVYDAIRGNRNRLRYLIHYQLMVIRREPALTRLVWQELRPDPAHRGSRLFKLNQTYTRRIVTLIRDGIASGEFRPGIDPGLVRSIVFGTIEHHTWAFLRNEGDFDPEVTADQLADVIYYGLLVQGGGVAQPGQDTMLHRLEAAVTRLERMAQP